MAISAEQIVQLYEERKKERGPLMSQWEEVTRAANNAIVVNIAELNESSKATVVNLFPQGLEQFATRAGSMLPDQKWPPLREGFDNSENKADDRLHAGKGFWKMNKMNLLIRHRFRFYFAYGSMPVSLSPVAVSPLDKRRIPHWRVRNPMVTFPSPCDPNDMEPINCIFAATHTRKWLTETYPAAAARFINPQNQYYVRQDDRFTILEYNDCDETVMVCCGQEKTTLWLPGGQNNSVTACVELERMPNKACMPLFVIPGRISLDQVCGALDQMLPGYRQAAKLNALNEMAIMRGIFASQWAVSHPGDAQDVSIEVEADGERGIIGEISHGTIVQLQGAPAAAQVANMSLDRLERQQRLAVGLPAELGGESGTNIRTARRGADVLGSAIDMPIQEADEIAAASLEFEMRRAVAIQKGWYGDTKTSFVNVPFDGSTPTYCDYTPNEIFETDVCEVIYPMPGVDAAAIPIELGQRLNEGLISAHTARLKDPLIEDALWEGDQIELEGLGRALLASLEQQAQQGTLGPDQLAAIAKLRAAKHMDLWDVVLEVHKEMQAQQAANQQLPAGAPQNMPGLGQGPPGGQPAGPPGGGGPPNPFQGPPSSGALAQILGNLRQPAAQSTPEQQMQPPIPGQS